MELVIVIAISGLLTSVVIASTTQARAKARDTRRTSDMKEIQLGLALYYDVNRSYPADYNGLSILVAEKYIPSLPLDPLGQPYEYLTAAGKYCLGAKFESAIPDDSALACPGGYTGTVSNYWAQR